MSNSFATPKQTVDDLFAFSNRYPGTPGHRGGETSRAAAEKIAPVAGVLRGKVAELFASVHPKGLTADEAAKRLDRTAFSIRPRLSELSAAHLIEKTGERGINESGMSAAVWRATALLLQSAGSPLPVPDGGAE